MDILKHIPGTEPWKHEKAENLKVLWSMGIAYGHEVTLPDDPEAAGALVEAVLSKDDGSYVDTAEARVAVQEALDEGPAYNQRVLCLGYDEGGNPDVLFL